MPKLPLDGQQAHWLHQVSGSSTNYLCSGSAMGPLLGAVSNKSAPAPKGCSQAVKIQRRAGQHRRPLYKQIGHHHR
jgi:hypothetical protein